MVRLLKIEWHKIVGNRAFWVMILLHMLLLFPAAYALEGFINSFTFTVNGQAQVPATTMLPDGFSVFNYPQVWQNMAYLATWFQLILGVIVVILVSNEYSARTLRQNIIDGMSKGQVILAKELVIVLISLVASLMLVTLTVLMGISKEGVSFTEEMHFVFAYFFGLMIFLNMAYFFASWLKKAGFAIGMLVLYTYIIEGIVGFFLPDNIATYLPVHLVDSMVPFPGGGLMGEETAANLNPISITMGCIYIAGFLLLNYWMLKKGHAAK